MTAVESLEPPDSLFEKTIKPAELQVDLSWDADLGLNLLEALKKLDSTSLTVLPKRYWCKTLIISCYADWDCDSFGIDISRLETQELAHYWCTSEKRMEEWDEELRSRGIPVENDSPLQEEHAVVCNVWLLEWPDGTWTWEEE